MDKNQILSGCAMCGMSRRNFLAAGCAACAGAAGMLAAPGSRRMAYAADKKMRIRVVYALHAVKQPGPDWPNVGFDFAPVMERINGALTQALPAFEFIPVTATGPDEAKKILAADNDAKDIDGYLVYQMNAWNQVIQTLATSGKPVLYADFQFGGSGGFLVYMAGFLRQNTSNIGFVSSSNVEDLIEAVKCFEPAIKNGDAKGFAAATAKVRVARTQPQGDMACSADAVKTLDPQECIRQLKASKILAVNNPDPNYMKSFMDIPVVLVPFAEVNEAWAKADKDEARAVADRWQKNAALVEGVSRETLETSAAMYLGQKAVLKKYDANAITMNCLGGFYGGHIHAYPCLGFHELCNEGLVGACECDVRSTASMLACKIMTQGRPGYISDPVVDTAKRQIIYAHCVASNRPFGPEGPVNPYEILTHSEDRQGASVRSVLPVGFMTTTVEFEPSRKQMLFHQAKAVANDPDDRACRTKLCGDPVGDIEKLFTQWDQWSWHRVTCYGDLKEPFFALADAMGYSVVEEA